MCACVCLYECVCAYVICIVCAIYVEIYEGVDFDR